MATALAGSPRGFFYWCSSRLFSWENSSSRLILLGPKDAQLGEKFSKINRVIPTARPPPRPHSGRPNLMLPAALRTVAHLNVEHFRHLFEGEMDETRRQTLLRLLAEEEAKLKVSTKPSEKKNEGE